MLAQARNPLPRSFPAVKPRCLRVIVDDSAFGFGALFSNISGNDNTASGTGALGYNSTGYWNTARQWIRDPQPQHYG